MGLLKGFAEDFRDSVLAEIRVDKEKELGQRIPDDVWFDWVFEATGLRPIGQH